MLKRLFVLLLILIPTLGVAHPGHGKEGGNFSLLHYLSEPLHLISGIVVLSIFVLLCTRFLSKRLPQ